MRPDSQCGWKLGFGVYASLFLFNTIAAVAIFNGRTEVKNTGDEISRSKVVEILAVRLTEEDVDLKRATFQRISETCQRGHHKHENIYIIVLAYHI